MPKARLGSGARFAALSSKLAGKGVRNPDALAAYIGRKKLGAAKFNKLAAAGRSRHSQTDQYVHQQRARGAKGY